MKATTTKPTLCWECDNMACSRMKRCIPVPGWTAERTTLFTKSEYKGVISTIEMKSYCVSACPEFITGRKEKKDTIKYEKPIYSKVKKKQNARKVICLTDGKVFPTITEAAAHYRSSRSNISKCCRKIIETCDSREFQYYEEAKS